MDRIRADKWQQLINLLHEADALQQELLGGSDETESDCYLFHSRLNDIADEFECFAAEEEQAAEAG
jgi:hypothetical protein